MTALHKVLTFLFLIFACATLPVAAERVTAEGGCPDLEHDPVVAVPRGTPAEITATIECPEGTLGNIYLQVRLTDIGKPVEIEMKKGSDDAYEATVPASMFAGLKRFWYYVDARGTNTEGEATMAQTRWHTVMILDPIVGANLSETPSAAGAGGSGSAFGWFVGGAAALGAGFALDHNQSGYHRGNSQNSGAAVSSAGANGSGDPTRSASRRSASPSESGSESPAVLPPSSGGGGGGGPPDVCVTTGTEEVWLGNTSPCGSGGINVYFCGYCPGATLRVETTWGVSGQTVGIARRSGRERTGLTPVDCSPGISPAITVPKPDPRPPTAESQTISVYVNDVLIQQFQWPSSAEQSECDGGGGGVI